MILVFFPVDYIFKMDSCELMRKVECKFKNLRLEKNVKQVEVKVNALSEVSKELHCLREDFTLLGKKKK